jgi:hypothetical protein
VTPTAALTGALGALAAALAAALGGCTLITDSFLTNDFSGDPFPTYVDTSTGAIMVGLHPQSSPAGDNRDAVLDLLSPITVVDSGPRSTPSVSYTDLLMLGQRTPGSATEVVRARFPDSQLVALHPCPDKLDDGSPNPDCQIGPPGQTRTFGGIIGADVLAGDAVRLRLGDDQIFVLADVGGSDHGRALSCDGVFGSPYRGGGTLSIAGTELPFGNRRITLQACLGADPRPADPMTTDPAPAPAEPDPQLAITDTDIRSVFPEPSGSCDRESSRKKIADSLQQNGADVLFVVSTGTGTSILGAAAYGRYLDARRNAHQDVPPPLEALPDGAVYLPSGRVDGKRATIDRLWLVGASSSNALAPCRQVYAHRLLSALGPIDSSEFDTCTVDNGNGATSSMSAAAFRFASPCKDSSSFCPVPTILEVSPQDGIDLLVVDDTNATLQALRAELRPDQPEVDGILGTDALRTVELDIDFPHDRVLARCPAGDCIVRPPLAESGDRCQINRCIKGLTDLRFRAPMGAMPDDKNLPGCPVTPN